MKLFNYLIIGIASLILSQPVLSKGYVDKDYKNYQTERNKVLAKLKDCNSKRFKTVGDINTCRQKVIEEANNKYPARGTDAYSQQYYSKLTTEQANNKIIELKKIYDVARVSSISKQPGELLKKEVMTEAAWIQNNILGRKRTTDVNVFVVPCENKTGKYIKKLCIAGTNEVVDVD